MADANTDWKGREACESELVQVRAKGDRLVEVLERAALAYKCHGNGSNRFCTLCGNAGSCFYKEIRSAIQDWQS